MALKKHSTQKNDAKLEPFVEDGAAAVNGLKFDSRISPRAEKLRRLLTARKSKSAQDKTVRLGDKKSASSLSLLFPGLGQIYMGRVVLGWAFALTNIVLLSVYLFFGGVVNLSSLWNKILPSYDIHTLVIAPLAITILSAMSTHMAFYWFPKFRLANLIAKNKKGNPYWLSVIFPGFGQILNGQPKKAIAFSSIAILGVFSFISTFSIYFSHWDGYAGAFGAIYVEKFLLVLGVFVVVAAFSYILSVFDTFVVKNNPYIKRNIWSRFKRYWGIERSVHDRAPYRKTNLKFVFVSIFFILFMGVNLTGDSSRSFYGEKISRVKIIFKAKGMKLLPGLIDKIKMPERIKSFTKNFE